MSKDITGYELSRNWFNWSFDNPDLVKPIHSAVYFFAIEHCNRLGWKEKFGFPSQMVMEAIGVKNWRTYSKALNDLVDFGFIKMIEISKNQYSSNIIAIVKNTKAPTKASTKALDKALSKHSTKHSQSTVSIDKQLTINNKQLTEDTALPFSFYNSLLKLGADKKLISEWLKVRKTKKATNSETAFNSFKNQLDNSGKNINEVLEICVVRSWSGFNNNWLTNLDNNNNLKSENNEQLKQITSITRELYPDL